jgi:hypothetical protein
MSIECKCRCGRDVPIVALTTARARGSSLQCSKCGHEWQPHDIASVLDGGPDTSHARHAGSEVAPPSAPVLQEEASEEDEGDDDEYFDIPLCELGYQSVRCGSCGRPIHRSERVGAWMSDPSYYCMQCATAKLELGREEDEQDAEEQEREARDEEQERSDGIESELLRLDAELGVCAAPDQQAVTRRAISALEERRARETHLPLEYRTLRRGDGIWLLDVDDDGDHDGSGRLVRRTYEAPYVPYDERGAHVWLADDEGEAYAFPIDALQPSRPGDPVVRGAGSDVVGPDARSAHSGHRYGAYADVCCRRVPPTSPRLRWHEALQFCGFRPVIS